MPFSCRGSGERLWAACEMLHTGFISLRLCIGCSMLPMRSIASLKVLILYPLEFGCALSFWRSTVRLAYNALLCDIAYRIPALSMSRIAWLARVSDEE